MSVPNEELVNKVIDYIKKQFNVVPEFFPADGMTHVVYHNYDYLSLMDKISQHTYKNYEVKIEAGVWDDNFLILVKIYFEFSDGNQKWHILRISEF